MNASPAILKFSEVTVESSPQYETGLWNTSFELNQGCLMLVRIERENERLPLADAAQGLALPAQGSVMFLGEDWRRMSADPRWLHNVGKSGACSKTKAGLATSMWTRTSCWHSATTRREARMNSWTKR